MLYRSEPRLFEAYNVAGPRPVSLKAVDEILANIVGWRGTVRWGLKPRLVDPNFLLLHTYKLKALGWSPRYDIAEGLNDYVRRLGNVLKILRLPRRGVTSS